MPLLLINDDKIFDMPKTEQKKELLKYAKKFSGKVQTIVPSNRDEWADTIKKYKARNESKTYPQTVILVGGSDYNYPDK